MNPSAAAPLWIPEDDFLLKNAVEAGASLESLAKGAVRFSRRYSLTQIQDRWRSILYGPEESAKAAASMLNLELSRFAGAGAGAKEAASDAGNGRRVKMKIETFRKRKRDSLRKQYYERMRMRKLIRMEVLDSLDIGFDDGVRIVDDAVGYEGDEIGGNLNCDMNHLHVDSVVGFDEAGVGPLNSMSDAPLWKTIEDVSAPVLPSGNAVLSVPGGAAVLGEEGVRISDSLMDLTNGDDEGLLLDGTAKEKLGCDDKIVSENVDASVVVPELLKLDTGTKLAVRRGSSAAELGVGFNSSGESHGDMDLVSDPGNEVRPSSATAAVQSPHPERSEDLRICVLNTEDTDVPVNDSVNLSVVAPRSVAMKSQRVANDCVNVSDVVPRSVVANDCVNVSVVAPRSVPLKSQSIAKEVGYSDPSISNQRKNVPAGSLEKEEMNRAGLVPTINSSNTPIGVVMKAEISTGNSISAVSRQNNNVNIKPSQSRLGHAKQEEIDALASAVVYAHPKAKDHMASKKLEEKSLSHRQEEGDDDDSDADDSDEDEIPYYSDAEKMILEMDLCPADEDINASREVLEYQHEETKRAIMRLEQCAHAFTQRAIASEGALAVLYGRKMKQYIKKSEVRLEIRTSCFPLNNGSRNLYLYCLPLTHHNEFYKILF